MNLSTTTLILLATSLWFIDLISCSSSSSSSDSSGSSDSSSSSDEISGEYASLFTDSEYLTIKDKRIRREIRDLESDQWDRVADALNIMKHTSQSEGESLYGMSFRNYDTLICQHAHAALHSNGDLGHFGPHFLLWHRAWVLSVENSLLQIDSEIDGAPYWDWRRDIPHNGTHYTSDVAELDDSIVFSDDYLGSYVGDSSMYYSVTDGKFAYWEVNSDADDVGCGSFYQNPYGMLRLRTNANSNQYVTRVGGNQCGRSFAVGSNNVYEECLTSTDSDDIGSFFWCFDQVVHGGPHLGVGGTFNPFVDDPSVFRPGCLGFAFASNLRTIDRDSEAAESGYRNGCFDCPDAGECGTVGDDIDFDCAVCHGGSCLLNNGDTLVITADRDVQDIVGDFVDVSTSPNDALFLFHHANMDRYLMEWQLIHYDSMPYYGYPESGFVKGINLNDVVSDEYPFENIFNMYDTDGNIIDDSGSSSSSSSDDEPASDNAGPYTFADIWDETTFLNAPYTFDSVLELIFRDD